MSAEVLTAKGTAEAPGFYGKLPVRGDFLGRRLGREFVREWDTWLQQVIPASHETLGERWLEFYLVSPLWRFILQAKSCGPNSVVGVMMPSVDCVGRYFPLMLGRELAPELDMSDFLPRSSVWYDAIEELALSALAPEFDLESFDRPLALEVATRQDLPVQECAVEAAPRHIVIDPSDPDRLATLIDSSAMGMPPKSFWWTLGSEHIAPCLLVCPGMPQGPPFAALLNGDWASAGWMSDAPAPAAAQPTQDQPHAP